MDKVKCLLKDINNAKTITVLTGAGISTASGIPDYRGKSGLYNTIGPESILTPAFLSENPKAFHKFVVENMIFEDAKPNIIHEVLNELQKEKTINIITQNIDNLHEKAGSKNIIHMHNMTSPIYCTSCNKQYDIDTYKKNYKCPECGGILRPNFVLYYENVNLKNYSLALEQIVESDLILVIGTTLKVYPFAELIEYANNYCNNKNAKIVLINNEVINGVFDYKIIGDATKVFNEIKNNF